MLSMKGAGVLGLLEEKGLTIEQRRRIIATATALDLIAVAVAPQASSHTLSEEMKQLSQYVDAIESALRLTRP
jgi:multisubunit Na+/H+ antiporter MnhC subunit